MSETPSAERDGSGRTREGPTCLREADASLRQRQAMTGDAVSAWFVREILPLEAILMHYLRQNWRNASDIPDLRQEIYTRVFEAAREHVPVNPKRFLLTAARNLLIDRVRREQVVPMEAFADFDALDIASDAPIADRQLIEQEDITRLEAALPQLPPRTREAISLAYFEGLSCTEIARRMGVTHQVASEFIAKGTLILGDILFGESGGRSAKS